ncbi:NAD(P)H-binding protein [Candidatus Saccharibacteria bacterium]|nr:NAD(P)H-binding protein [Candidatus Saccharibacteria bacterium]
MNIAVIAANGRSGKAFVAEALAAGHSVKAGVHGSSDLQPHEQLAVVPCDATKEEDLRMLLEGQDAAVSFIGHVKGSPANVQTDAMNVLVRVMETLGIKRVVSLTGTGVRFPGDKISLVDRFLNFGVSVVDPARVNDGRDHVEVLKQSNLDWTVLRVLKLENITPMPFTLREHGPTKWVVSRQDVAKAVLQVLEEASFIRQAPILSR